MRIGGSGRVWAARIKVSKRFTTLSRSALALLSVQCGRPRCFYLVVKSPECAGETVARGTEKEREVDRKEEREWPPLAGE